MNPDDLKAYYESQVEKSAYWDKNTNHIKELLSRSDFLRQISHSRISARLHGGNRARWIDATGILCEWALKYGTSLQTVNSPSRLHEDNDDLDQIVYWAFDLAHLDNLLQMNDWYGCPTEWTSQRKLTIGAPNRLDLLYLDEALNQMTWKDESIRVANEQEIADCLSSAANFVSSAPLEQQKLRKSLIFDQTELQIFSLLKDAPNPLPFRVLNSYDKIGNIPATAIIGAWHYLWCLCLTRELVAQSIRYPHIESLTITLSDLAHSIKEFHGKHSIKTYKQAIHFLTLKKSKLHAFNREAPRGDYGLFPLIDIGNSELLIQAGLTTENNVERVLLRLLAQDRRQWQSEYAKRVDWSKEIASDLAATVDRDLLVATETQMYWKNGQTAGDLDIAIVDPKTKQGLLVEAAGGIVPASKYEIAYLRNRMLDKIAKQIPRLKEAFWSASTRICFPDSWPSRFDIQWHWAVAGPNYQGWDLNQCEEFEASVGVAQLFQPHDNLIDLINVLKSPPIPNATFKSSSFEVGHIEVDYLEPVFD